MRQLLTTGVARPAIAPIAIGPALTPYHHAPPSAAEYDTLVALEACP